MSNSIENFGIENNSEQNRDRIKKKFRNEIAVISLGALKEENDSILSEDNK